MSYWTPVLLLKSWEKKLLSLNVVAEKLRENVINVFETNEQTCNLVRNKIQKENRVDLNKESMLKKSKEYHFFRQWNCFCDLSVEAIAIA